MSLASLLEVLADGRFHSGEELGERLQVSRTAVWKQLKKLSDLGIELYSVKGRGYRIPGGLDLLSEREIRRRLEAEVQARLAGIELALSLESTNARALAACQQENCHGRLYLAERQTAGRGRRGRPWHSPFARNLYCSLVWGFSGGAAALEGLSLVVGLALVEGLARAGLHTAQLKWPNDLLYEGRKFGGILLEMTGDASGVCQVVIGFGVNVDMPGDGAETIDQPWTDLARIEPRGWARNPLVGCLLNTLVPMLGQFEREGFAPFRERWQRHHAHQGQPVWLSTPRLQIAGRCLGVDENGAILLETPEGVRAYHGGEISLRSPR